MMESRHDLLVIRDGDYPIVGGEKDGVVDVLGRSLDLVKKGRLFLETRVGYLLGEGRG